LPSLVTKVIQGERTLSRGDGNSASCPKET
jgi:hypothetical protein